MNDRYWIGEVRSRCVKTVLVKANSRKEAEMKIKNSAFDHDIEGIDVHYTPTGDGRIIREDKRSDRKT